MCIYVHTHTFVAGCQPGWFCISGRAWDCEWDMQPFILAAQEFVLSGHQQCVQTAGLDGGGDDVTEWPLHHRHASLACSEKPGDRSRCCGVLLRASAAHAAKDVDHLSATPATLGSFKD